MIARCRWLCRLCRSPHVRNVRSIHAASSLPANCFYTPAGEAANGDTKRLALLIGWIGSKHRHVDKYAEMYRNLGLDTLVVLPTPKHVIMPSSGKDYMQKVLDALMDKDEDQTRLLVHGFSVGGYMYGHLLNLLKAGDAAAMRDFHERCKGQIFDSIVDFEGVPFGLSTAMLGSSNPMQVGMEKLLEAYLSVLHNQVTVQYIASSEAFHQNHVPAKAMMFYSAEDPISCPKAINTVVAKWKAAGKEVEEVNFGDSPHVGHYRKYPQTYSNHLERFVESAFIK